MLTAKLALRIEQLETQFLLKEEKALQDVNQAVKRENALSVAIQSLSTWISQLKKQGTDEELLAKGLEVREQLKEKMRAVSAVILESVNEQYQTEFSLIQFIEGQEGAYYTNGILNILHRSGKIHELFQKLLADIIPIHPKDEYPLARQMKRKFVIHAGPTNSGKTYESIEALKDGEKGIYLSPLRLLALEIYEKLNAEGVPCSLLTGEEEIRDSHARHWACTIEKADYHQLFDVAVIDEGQMIGDSQRGFAWTRAILGILAKKIHICCSINAVTLIKRLIMDCEDDVEVIYHERQTPLIIQDESFSFPKDVKVGDAFIVFSRKKVLQVAADLGKYNITSSVIYGNLPPETRRKQVNLFLNRETEVVVSTDAIGMGMNLPIQRIVFLETEKYDGSGVRELNSQEIKQIAGRAGRKGIYEIGFVNALKAKKNIATKLISSDGDIEAAFIAPHDETILGLPFGSLKERLKAWMNHEIRTAYFRLADISEILELLDLASGYESVIPIEVLYKAVTIPFDYKERELLKQWFFYIDCLKMQRNRLPKPRRRKHGLTGLEIYYRAIGLYYSFSRVFQLEFDLRWIKKERAKTAEEIHQLLKEQNKVFELI
ncbi:MAG TPA: DEAD/DEAH box helicase [Bacillota bacterium]|nr:DEAD/DEAH box helicase [Bacillota bacterium]